MASRGAAARRGGARARRGGRLSRPRRRDPPASRQGRASSTASSLSRRSRTRPIPRLRASARRRSRRNTSMRGAETHARSQHPHRHTHIRTHLEVALIPGHRLARLEASCRSSAISCAVDIEICVFPQERAVHNPGNRGADIAALRQGVVGDRAPAPIITNTDPHGQIARIFALARELASTSTWLRSCLEPTE